MLRTHTLTTLLVSSIVLFFLAGCNFLGPQTPQGATIEVQGPPNDTVQFNGVQNGPNVLSSCACTNCGTIGTVLIPSAAGSNGLAVSAPVAHVADGASYNLASLAGPTPCMGGPQAVVACPPPNSPIVLNCNALPANGAAGQMTISGAEEEYCSSRDPSLNLQPGPCPAGSNSDTICDVGTVSITVNGHTVSATLDCNSNPRTVAFQLATALDQDSTLGPQFVSASQGPVSYVRALNSGSQYNYPWTSSSSCSSRILFVFGQCSFSAGLSPASSLSGGQ